MNYKTVKYSEIGKIKSGKRLPKGYSVSEKKSNNKYIRVRDINNGSIDSSIVQYISDEAAEKLERYRVKTNDVIISVVGTVGAIAQIDETLDGAYLTENCDNLQVDESLCIKDYLKYYLLSKDGSKEIIANTVGSTQPKLPIYGIENFNIKLPNINDQKRIVKLLNSIDNKISKNNEINNNLLQLCRYKYDELNKKYDEWDLVKINDLNLEVTDYVANGSFKSLADNVTLYDDKEYALYVRNTDLKVNFTDKRKYVDQKSYEFLKKSKLKGGELIISNVGDVGSVFICPHLNMPMTLGSNVIMLYETDSHYYNYFLYFFFTSVYGQYMIGGITGGSAQPKFNKTDFRNMEIKFPAFGELDKFNAEIDPIYKKYELNIKENEKLSELRDTLLPKLMNGEIDLDNIEL